MIEREENYKVSSLINFYLVASKRGNKLKIDNYSIIF